MIIGRLEMDGHFHFAPPLPAPLLQTVFGREGGDGHTDATTSLNRVQDEFLVAAEFPADFEKKYMRVSSRARTLPPLTPAQWLPKSATIWFPHKRRALRAPWSPLRGEGEAGGRFGA